MTTSPPASETATPHPLTAPFRQAKRQKLKDSSAAAYIGAAPPEGVEGAGGGGGGGSSIVVTSDSGKDVS
jgi:hypothetical protein